MSSTALLITVHTPANSDEADCPAKRAATAVVTSSIAVDKNFIPIPTDGNPVMQNQNGGILWDLIAVTTVSAFGPVVRVDELQSIREAVAARMDAIQTMSVKFKIQWKILKDPRGRKIDRPAEGERLGEWIMADGHWADIEIRDGSRQTIIFDGNSTTRVNTGVGAGRLVTAGEVRPPYYRPHHAAGVWIQGTLTTMKDLVMLETARVVGDTEVLETPCVEIDFGAVAGMDQRGQQTESKQLISASFEKAPPHRLRRVHYQQDLARITDPVELARAKTLSHELIITEFFDVDLGSEKGSISFPREYVHRSLYTTNTVTVTAIKLNAK